MLDNRPDHPRRAVSAPSPRVVILGGGFGGLEAAKRLASSPASITVIDRQNHHCFQPLLYQVATASLTPADVAWPIRGILGKRPNVRVVMAEVQSVDRAARVVETSDGSFPYDFLVVATGATHAYFGHEEWATHARGLKRIEDATDIRGRLLIAFEKAELAADEDARRALMTFVVVGAGPTGVEMAGAIAELARNALPPDFRSVDPAKARILLIEAGPRVLAAFPERLSRYAQRALERMGVEVMTSAPVTEITAQAVTVGGHSIAAGAVIWAAGVAASGAAAWLDAEHDRAGRVIVTSGLTLPGYPEIFVVGDTAAVMDEEGRQAPGVAPAAKQMGAYAARVVAAKIRGRPGPPRFRYRHQGDLATIGRQAAIVKLKGATLTGFPAWVFWSVAHIYFLIGLRNRIAVAFNWLWDYATFGRRSRLIISSAHGA